jgi:hypothetical protein
MIRVSAVVQTASKAVVNFAVADQEPEPVGAVAEVHEQVDLPRVFRTA